jgi:osmotically inducible protein OsmC
MQLSLYYRRGFEIESIETKCDIDLVDGAVISSHLTVNAKKGISDDAFQQQVTKAEKNCPISKLLTAAISTTATLL